MENSLNYLQIIKFVLPIVLAWVIDRLIMTFFDGERVRQKLHFIIMRSLVRFAVWVTALFTTLSFIPTFSRTWETLIASSGIAAVVLGLAAQSTLSNMFAGIAMVGRNRPFDVGDRIQVGDADPGFVTDITLRHVVVRTFQNETIYIPNSVAGNSVIVNYTKMTAYSYPITVSVAYGSDVRLAMDVMASVIAHHPKYAGDEEVPVLCRDLGDSGITLRAMMTTEQFIDNPIACSDCRIDILRRFKEEGIEIPYPHMDVTMRNTESK